MARKKKIGKYTHGCAVHLGKRGGLAHHVAKTISLFHKGRK